MRTDRGLLWGYEKTYSRQWKKGHPGEAEKLAADALDGGMDPLRIVEEAMMPAMRSAGERYKNEETDMLRILAPAGSGAYGADACTENGAEAAANGFYMSLATGE